MALQHGNNGKVNGNSGTVNANMKGGSAKEIGSVNRESDLGKLCKLSGVREIHGVDRLVECQVIWIRMAALHVRMSAGRNESGRDNVRRWRSGNGRCR